MKKDTIAAISTAVSESGIGIIRISGEEAFEVADRVWQSPGKKKRLSMQPANTIHYGYIYDALFSPIHNNRSHWRKEVE